MLKRTFLIASFLFFACLLQAQQFYFRGVVKDELGSVLPNVRIIQLSTGLMFRSGSLGTFGVVSNTTVDSFLFNLEGHQSFSAAWQSDRYVEITLRRPVDAAPAYSLSSLTSGWNRQEARKWLTGNETYANLLENRFVRADVYPNTGLSLNMDRASYSNIRRFIRQRSQAPIDAVRIEEMLNYFNLGYQRPDSGQVFRVQTRLSDCPWNARNKLFFLQISARELNLDTLPPTHFTFLIDVSASMDMPNRLPLLQSAFRMLVGHLRAKDSVAIVTYGGVTDILLNTISGRYKDSIRQVIDSLVAGGATPGESGVRLAYSVARRHFIPGGNNRVILATDGDFNVGMKSEEELEGLIVGESERGIYLTCLGVGMGNYKDSKIQLLAKRGNGNFAYLDGFQEAEKVLFKEFAQTLYSVADDAALNAQFNPDRVEEYRLIGFDNKLGALRDSTTQVQGGEVGTGQSTLAIFELRMREDSARTGSLARIQLNYRLPKDSVLQQYDTLVSPRWQSLNQLDSAYRFATAITWFGSLLRYSGFVPAKSWDSFVKFTNNVIATSDPYQQEFAQLVQAADFIYHPKKKRGKGRKKG